MNWILRSFLLHRFLERILRKLLWIFSWFALFCNFFEDLFNKRHIFKWHFIDVKSNNCDSFARWQVLVNKWKSTQRSFILFLFIFAHWLEIHFTLICIKIYTSCESSKKKKKRVIKNENDQLEAGWTKWDGYTK